jgi:hypothetical protein
VALAIEMGADAVGLTVHPHPTLSETIALLRRSVRRHAHRPLPAEAPLAWKIHEELAGADQAVEIV